MMLDFVNEWTAVKAIVVWMNKVCVKKVMVCCKISLTPFQNADL